jgi:signal transduction histidine kinase
MKSVKSVNPIESVIQTTYDIIKAHGGDIKVETKEARPDDPVGRGGGAEFIIQLAAQ